MNRIFPKLFLFFSARIAVASIKKRIATNDAKVILLSLELLDVAM